MKWFYFFLFLCFLMPLRSGAEEAGIPLDHVDINSTDKASLQRGAKIFMNYCLGCHSLEYTRYDSMAKGIGMVDKNGKVMEKIVNENLIFTGDPIADAVRTAMSQEDAKRWFGVAPPDLTLIARVRGTDWLYTYLKNFYYDPQRPWGTNNRLYPNVAMPNVLLPLQGLRVPVYRKESVIINGRKKEIQIIDHLITVKRGTMAPIDFDNVMTDLVNFLSYISEPNKEEREKLGIWVVIFLLIFLVVVIALKKEYWKKVSRLR